MCTPRRPGLPRPSSGSPCYSVNAVGLFVTHNRDTGRTPPSPRTTTRPPRCLAITSSGVGHLPPAIGATDQSHRVGERASPSGVRPRGRGPPGPEDWVGRLPAWRVTRAPHDSPDRPSGMRMWSTAATACTASCAVPGGSDRTRRVHDDGDSGEADEGADDVELVGAEAVYDHAPRE